MNFITEVSTITDADIKINGRGKTIDTIGALRPRDVDPIIQEHVDQIEVWGY